MRRNYILMIIFIVVALAQLYVPASMIFERNDILKTGKEFRFRTAPIDPYDPFRGKYVWLNFQNNRIAVTDTTWMSGETVYAVLTEDSSGMAKVASIHRDIPGHTNDYLKTSIRYISYDLITVHLEFPFDRYYMEESKAYPAEQAYLEASQDTSIVAYALVNIKNGEAVLKDVHINGTPIREIARRALEAPENKEE